MSTTKTYPINLTMKAQTIILVQRQMKRNGWTVAGLASKSYLNASTVKNFLDSEKNCMLSTYECVCWACDIVCAITVIETDDEVSTVTKLRIVRGGRAARGVQWERKAG